MADFPTYLSLEFDGNTRGLDTLSRFAGQSGQKAGKEFATGFESNARQIGDTLSKALSIPRNAGGSLDLSETIRELRRAEKEANAYSLAAKEMARAQTTVLNSSAALSREQAQEVRELREIARERANAATSLGMQARAYEKLQAEMSKTASATTQVVQAANRGTTAFGAVTNSTASMRQATLQAGQQFQDIAISIGSGQRASTVFAQQLPQLALALSGVKGEAGSLASKVGSVATFLAGPWGVALAIGAFALGPLIDGLFKTEKGADDTGSATDRLANKLELSKNSYETLIAVVNEYNKAQEKTEGLTYSAIVAAQNLAVANLNSAKATQELYLAETLRGPTGPNGQGQLAASIITSQAGDRIKKLEEDLQNANRAVANFRVEQRLDPKKKIQDESDLSLIRLQERQKKGLLSDKAYEDKRYQIKKSTADKIEALQKPNRHTSDTANRQYGREVNTAEAVSIAKRNGFQVNSARRPTYISQEVKGGGSSQERLYNAWTAAGKPKDNPVAVPGTSRHETGKALDIQFGPNVSVASIRKAYADEGVKLTKIFKERGHYHIEFNTSGAEKAESQANKIAKETERLGRVSDSAAESISRINEQFDDQPRLVDQSNQAMRRLQKIIAEVEGEGKNKDGTYKVARGAELIAEAKAAKVVASNAPTADFQRQNASFSDRLQIQKLILAGRVDEAAIAEKIAQLEERYGSGKRLEQLKDERRQAEYILTAEGFTQKERDAANETLKSTSDEYARLSKFADYILKTTAEQYSQDKAISEALDKRNASVQRYRSFLDGTYSSLENLLSGGSAGDFFKSIKSQFQQLQGQNLTESLFGDSFRKLREYTERNNPENVAVNSLVTQTNAAAEAAKTIADAFLTQAGRIDGAANDNATDASASTESGVDGSQITVVAPIRKAIEDRDKYNAAQYAKSVAKEIIDPLVDNLNDTFGTKFFTQFSGVLSGALSGYMRAGEVGGVLGGAQGLFDTLSKSTKIGAKTAASFSKISEGFGKGLAGAQTGDQTAQLLKSFGVKTSRTGGQIGGALGQVVGGPIGGLIGSVLGSIGGGLLKKTKTGKLILNSATSDITTSGKLGSQLSGAGGSIQSSLNSIAERLGGTVGGFNVSIGKRGDYFRVSGSGASNVDTKKTKNINGLIYDGKDEAEATRIALLNAIQDGAIKGISQGAQRLLQSGKNLDAQVDKALRFQSIFDRLKQIEDPAGFALENLNREFSSLKSVAQEAGEGLVELERLYGYERAKVIEETTERLSGSLKSLIADLKTGENGLGLRDRLANARATFDPLANTIRSGGIVDADKFAEIARTVIDLQRQIDGSQTGYFDVFNDILGLSETALSRQRTAIEAASASGSPFTSPVASNDNVVGAIGTQTDTLVASLAAVQAQIAALGGSGFGSSGGGGNFQLAGALYF